MGQDADVAIASGQKVRTAEVTINVNGAPAVMEQQVVTIANAQGDQEDFVDTDWQAAVLIELREMRKLLGMLANQPTFLT